MEDEQSQNQRLGPPTSIIKVSETVWELPISYKKGMNVPARMYATEGIMQAMDAGVFEQVTNVASLPGIQKYAFCMPDGDWGYRFPIGGVAEIHTPNAHLAYKTHTFES